jgi:hypothetical protein
MKKIIFRNLLMLSIVFAPSCDVLDDVAGAMLDTSVNNGNGGSATLTNQEVIGGLKEALTIGIKNAVDVTSVTNGFLENQNIKLPFPQSAQKMKETAIEWGFESQVNDIVIQMNRAAEGAASKATPIFVNAIKNMTIQDGFQILNGGEGAATSFLRKNTEEQLITAFSPKVEESINEVKLTEYWNPVMTKYNKAMTFTGGEKVETDLTQYVTERAIDGLFHMVRKEENLIREDPAARVTSILQRVFGSLGQ